MTNINAYTEQTFFFHILENDNLLQVTKSDFFSNKNLKLAYEIAREFALEYKSPPSKDQILELIRVKGHNQDLSEDTITALYNTKVMLSQYDEKWLETNVSAWIKYRNVEHAFRKGLTYLKSTAVTAENAAEIVENVKHMMTTDMSVDFSFDLGADFFDPAAHLQSRLARTPTGYSFIDKCLKGGWWKGSLIAFLSGPKAGKCSSYDTKIKIRNKNSGEIKEINIGDFHEMVKKSYEGL
jgi:hypothetical protein